MILNKSQGQIGKTNLSAAVVFFLMCVLLMGWKVRSSEIRIHTQKRIAWLGSGPNVQWQQKQMVEMCCRLVMWPASVLLHTFKPAHRYEHAGTGASRGMY